MSRFLGEGRVCCRSEVSEKLFCAKTSIEYLADKRDQLTVNCGIGIDRSPKIGLGGFHMSEEECLAGYGENAWIDRCKRG